MTREDIFKTVDHTLLAQTATWEEIKAVSYTHLDVYKRQSMYIPTIP